MSRFRRYGAARVALADVEPLTTRNATAIVASTARPPFALSYPATALIRGYGLTKPNTTWS